MHELAPRFGTLRERAKQKRDPAPIAGSKFNQMRCELRELVLREIRNDPRKSPERRQLADVPPIDVGDQRTPVPVQIE